MLSVKQIQDIKSRSGEPARVLAEEYGVSVSTIHRTWYRIPRKDRIGKDGRAKITVEQVRQIALRLSKGEKQRDIAKDLGVSPRIISDINCGKTWRWVDQPVISE